MAIFHLSVAKTSRMKKGVAKLGQKTYSAVAGASYRSGSKFYDARNNQTHDFSNRSDIFQSKIFLPDEAKNCDWAKDREKLWNMVEISETRQTAVLYREVILSLPRELKPDANIAMVVEFINDKLTSHNIHQRISAKKIKTDNDINLTIIRNIGAVALRVNQFNF